MEWQSKWEVNRIEAGEIMGTLSTAKGRKGLNAGKKPYSEELGYPNSHLLYLRKEGKGKAGVWIARLYNPNSKKQRKATFGQADDYIESDNINIFSHDEAQQKALELVKKFASDFEEGISGSNAKKKADYTVKEAVEDYLSKLKRDGKKSYSKYKYMIDAHIIPELGDIKVKDLRREKVEIWRSKIANTPKRKNIKTSLTKVKITFADAPKDEDAARKRKVTANSVLRILKSALNNALKYGKIDEPKFGGWHQAELFKKVEEAKPYFLTTEEIKSLLAVINNVSFKNLCIAAYHTGARFKEITSLKVKSYNSEHKNIYFGVFGKTGEKGSRHVKLTEEGIAFFDRITENKNSDDLLFTKSNFYNRMPDRTEEENSIWKSGEQAYYMLKYCKLAGIPREKSFFHIWRHVFSSIRLNNGMSLSAIAYLLGHSTTEMVIKHYGHLAHENVDEMNTTNIPTILS